MKSPLALLRLDDGKGNIFWKVIQNESQARGIRALALVWVRDPTLEEEALVDPCLGMGRFRGKSYKLEELIGG